MSQERSIAQEGPSDPSRRRFLKLGVGLAVAAPIMFVGGAAGQFVVHSRRESSIQSELERRYPFPYRNTSESGTQDLRYEQLKKDLEQQRPEDMTFGLVSVLGALIAPLGLKIMLDSGFLEPVKPNSDTPNEPATNLD